MTGISRSSRREPISSNMFPTGSSEARAVSIARRNLNEAVSSTTPKAWSSAPTSPVILPKISRVSSTLAPIRSRTPVSARTFPKTEAVASMFPSNASVRVSSVASKPSSLICFRRPSADNPMPAKVRSACEVGLTSAFSIPRSWVDACDASVPVRDMAANAAPTSWNDTPRFDAMGSTWPIAPASSAGSNLPSRTAAVSVSTACAPPKTSAP